MNCTRTDEYEQIYHHGIKGQKWGVRRFQKKDGSLTTAGKKRYSDKADPDIDTTDDRTRKIAKRVAIGAAVVATALIVAGGVYVHKKNSYLSSIDTKSINRGKYAVDKMIDDTVIPKGSTIFRTSTHKTLRRDLTYASLTRDDKNRYITRMGQMYSDKKLYQMKLKTASDVKIPSEKKQFDLFVDLLANDEKFSKAVSYNPYGKTPNLFGDRKAAEAWASNYHYENFITRTINLGTKYDTDGTLSKYRDHIKRAGYQGLIDINDIGTTSKKPIIIFDTDTNLLIESSKALNLGMKFIAGIGLRNVD